MRPQSRYQKQSKAKPVVLTAYKHRVLFIGLIFFSMLLFAAGNSHAINRSNIHLAGYQSKEIAGQGLASNPNLHDEVYQHAMKVYERGEYHLAKRLLLPLANKDHTESQFYMGMIYDIGLGVERNANIAVSWYRKAAEKGYHHAQHNLAVAYANGDGVLANIEKALRWWERAARQGNTDSQYNLGIIYATGNELVKKDLLKAEKWWRLAAISGDAMAQYNLGTLYANGEKKVTSYCEAIRWWQQSAKAGINQALIAIEVLKQRPDYHPC
ncbi:MAG: tetratricopeptide repeat protein [Gammaproteobacteria bacterium]|jgi:TPR repeat protein